MKRSRAHTKYLAGMERQVGERRAKLTALETRIDSDIAAKRIAGSQQLRLALRQAKHHLDVGEARLNELKQADDDTFEPCRQLLDDAIEDLSQSIRKAMTRY
ncbi:MAG: hypothetical protein HKN56_00810 [Gammaproteobacteria bacterium]|nr:hypothetical protein [Gammaproteobacteria bacterium]